ncbi:MAG: hypothetical protein WC980_02970 [Candidatus Brocadiia bacterium]
MAKLPKLAEMLLDAKLLNNDQVQIALSKMEATGERFGAVIQKSGFIKGEVLMGFLAGQKGLEIVNVDNMIIPENLAKKIPVDLIEKYRFVPVLFKNGVITVAMTDPTDYEAIEQIQLATTWQVEVVITTVDDIERNIGRVLGKEKEDSSGKNAAMLNYKLNDPVVQLLIEKNIITKEELIHKLKGRK